MSSFTAEMYLTRVPPKAPAAPVSVSKFKQMWRPHSPVMETTACDRFDAPRTPPKVWATRAPPPSPAAMNFCLPFETAVRAM